MNAILKSSTLALIVVGFAALNGCASGTTTRPIHVADISKDPSWTPPGEMDVAIGGEARESTTSRVTAEAMPQPNKRIVLRNQLHAASY